MINYNKNKLINKTLDMYYDTFSHMLDTSEYVPEKYNEKIGKYIFKNMRKAFRLIDKVDRKYQREFKRRIKEKERLEKEAKGIKTHNLLLELFRKIFKKK